MPECILLLHHTATPMRRLATDYQPANAALVTSASPAVLRDLAAALACGDWAAVQALCVALDPEVDLRFRLAEVPHVEVSDTFFQIDLTMVAGSWLAHRLQDLATGAPYAEVSLITDASTHDQIDWTIRVVEGREDPVREYDPQGLGDMWIAMLYHPTPRKADYLRAWQAIRTWSMPDGHYPETLVVDRWGDPPPTKGLPAERAFADLVDDPRAAKAIGYSRVPFHRWYRESHDWLQVWFYKHATQLIVHDRHGATGHRAWDIDNFFLYRALILQVAETLDSSHLVWDVDIYEIEERDAVDLDALEDPAQLWKHFGRLHSRHGSEEAFQQVCKRIVFNV